MAAPRMRAAGGRGEPRPRRGPEQEYPLDWIDPTNPAVQLELQRQHVTPETVIPQGQHAAAAQRQHGY